MNNYLVAGFRKGSKDNSGHNFNVNLYTEDQLRNAFAWIDGEDSNNFRKGSQILILDDLIHEIKYSSSKSCRCETDYYFFVFKTI